MKLLRQHYLILKIIKNILRKQKKNLAEVRRKKWWLQHPEVAYFIAKTSWETNYGHSEWESELSFYVDSVIGVDGSQLDFHDRGWFDNYPYLEEDVLDDDEQFIKYENPFLCT